MFDVLLLGHSYKYEVAEFLRLFTSEFSIVEDSEDFNVFEDKNIIRNILDISDQDEYIYLSSVSEVFESGKKTYEKKIEDRIDKKKFAKNRKKIDNIIKTISKRIIQRSMFEYLDKKFEVNVPWGILTGIRPVKIIHSLIDEGMDEEEIKDFMKREYLISDEKLGLILDIAKNERKFIYPLSESKVSLYVSIPFCPTRCVYCSFPSNSLNGYGQYRHRYVCALIEEARGVADLLEKKNKEIESLYIGGGTPTSLEASDLEFLIKELFEIFDLKNIKEFTVEAGRPDTITEEKLKVLKKYGVGRISINPQTMNDDTLKKIGRKHSSKDIVDCFNLARKLGFDNINMDIILGLFDETPEMLKNTMEEILRLDPESVTVHTLALKRASELKINLDEYKSNLTAFNNIVEMIDISKSYLEKSGYLPYYMYRQKYMLGNLENVGYSKPGYECLYNMQIMEEKQSNYAIGAGAVSKFVYLDENRIERVDDVKNLEQYISRVDEMIKKKEREVMR